MVTFEMGVEIWSRLVHDTAENSLNLFSFGVKAKFDVQMIFINDLKLK